MLFVKVMSVSCIIVLKKPAKMMKLSIGWNLMRVMMPWIDTGEVKRHVPTSMNIKPTISLIYHIKNVKKRRREEMHRNIVKHVYYIPKPMSSMGKS